MARTPLVYSAGDRDPPAVLHVGGHPVPVWWHGPEPLHTQVLRLYVDERRGEREIAVALGISRARVAAVLDAEKVARGQWARVACPLTVEQLGAEIRAGGTAASLAREHGVSADTARRWLADAGLLDPDPALPPDLLRDLYLTQRQSTRQITAQTGVSRARVSHALAAAGIPARTRADRHGGGRRDAVTDQLLTALYVEQGLTLRQIATQLGVSTGYLSRRVRELALVKRPGRFGSRTGYGRDDLGQRAADLYGQGLGVGQVGRQLGVSGTTIVRALHEARIPLRGGGWRGRGQSPRTLLDDLYGDPAIADCLRRHQVKSPDPAGDWTPATRWESYAPLPLAPQLLRELYDDIGLALSHIALLCGVGVSAVRNGLRAAGVSLRPGGVPCPWNQQRMGNGSDRA